MSKLRSEFNYPAGAVMLTLALCVYFAVVGIVAASLWIGFVLEDWSIMTWFERGIMAVLIVVYGLLWPITFPLAAGGWLYHKWEERNRWL